MSADDLRRVRDDLLARLEGLDQARAEVLERLAELEAEDRIAALEDEAAEPGTAARGQGRGAPLDAQRPGRQRALGRGLSASPAAPGWPAG